MILSATCATSGCGSVSEGGRVMSLGYNIKKTGYRLTDQPTDQPIDQPTDRPPKQYTHPPKEMH